jgi:predicted alpha/beta hydrolase
MSWRPAAAAGVIACALAAQARAEETIVIPTRPGVTVGLTIDPAAGTPRAIVLLFPGGEGVVSRAAKNFVMRVRGDLTQQGFTTAAVDVPSDHGGGVDPAFRASDEAAQDIAAAIAEMKRRADLPVWLFGTSNGSISAANGAARIGPPRVAGVILTSSVWSGGMSNVALDRIAVPVLVVHNRNDACPVANFAGAGEAMTRLTAAPAKELVPVASTEAESRPCDPLSPHGYLGIEAQVVGPIVDWINAHPPARAN